MIEDALRALPASEQRIDRLIGNLCQGLRDDNITEIRLNQRGFSDKNAYALVEALSCNTSLRKLDIRGPLKLGAASFQSLCRTLTRHPSIRRLGFDEVVVGNEGARAIASILESSASLETLNLEASSIGQMGWDALASTLERNSTLRVMNLSRNHLTDNHVTSLAFAIQHNEACSLECIILSNNEIADDGVDKLAQALLHNATVKMLALPENRFSLRGLKAIEKMLEVNCYLKRMYLYGNRFPWSCPEREKVSYLLELNEAGRAEMGDECCRLLCPYLLARVSRQPKHLYGLLSELPHLWLPGDM